ncbi:Leucine rich repeat protein, partial [Spraguea lophii 42_110]
MSCEFLKILHINDNKLSAFPRKFFDFINLEELDISNNLFVTMPHELHSFANLRILNISFNRIENIIIENGMFNNMLKLNLSYNRITELSIFDNALQSLKNFVLTSNQITIIDKNIFNIPTLEKLELDGNRIELLPSNINNMRNRPLRINLYGNPLRSRLDEDLDNPELISIEEVNRDILRNIRYGVIGTFQETDIEIIRREYTNMNLNVKTYYEKLNIPADERLNLEEI